MTENLYYITHESVIGRLLLVASPRGLRYITLLAEGEAAEDLGTNFAEAQDATLTELPGFFRSATVEIDRYLTHGGPLKLPVDLAGGTALQRMVWLEIARIPHGETISYSELAERVGFPRAVRAVASACGANPVPLVIPCHRVLAMDGGLGGYSLGGTDVKEYLLLVESRKPHLAVA